METNGNVAFDCTETVASVPLNVTWSNVQSKVTKH